MSFVSVFNGQPQSPSQVSERDLALSVDTALFWPWNNADTDLITANILNVTPASGGLSALLPPANQASTGQAVIFRNYGGFPFTVKDFNGGVVATVNPGVAVFVDLGDNSTVAGVWHQLTFGAGGSSVDAATLAGMGLKAVATTLNQDHPVSVLSGDYTVSSADRAKVFTASPLVGTGTLNLPDVAVVGNGFFILFANQSTGQWIVDPFGGQNIDNAVTLVLNPGESAEIHCSGSQWYTVGKGKSTTFVITQLNKDVSGSSNVTLSPTEAGNIIQRYFGTLTASIAVIVPNTVQIFFAFNNTSGAFNLTVKTASGTGVAVPQGQHLILYCDGTNVLNAYTIVPPSSLSMADGTEASPGLAFTSEAGTGFYRPNTGQLGIATASVERVQIDSTGLQTKNGTPIIDNGLDILVLMAVFS